VRARSFADTRANFFNPSAGGYGNKKGACAAAQTPGDMQMQNTRNVQTMQDPLAFIREGQVAFNPVHASLILRECRYDRQRDETRAKGHIAALAEQMKRGLWLPKTQIDFARVGHKLVLVNGHHRMHAQILASATILWSVVVHECDTQEDLAALYWKFDTTIRKRSDANILHGIGFALTHGLRNTTAAALWRAVPIITNGMAFEVYSNRSEASLLIDARQSIAIDYVPEALALEGMIENAPAHVRKRLRAASRFAIALVTMRHQPDRASEFWRGLCEDDGLAKGDPRKTLLLDMMTRNAPAGMQASHMMASARAWSAFYSGARVGHIKVTGGAVKILGTPYTVQA